jgi:hypothetical protein
MSAGWEIDKRWSDRFLPEIKRELGEFLLTEPQVEEDQQRNTDLIVLKMDSVRIACRIRKNEYFQNPRFRHEFTIREGRPNGARTELSKIVEGWGQYLFYGFSNANQTSLEAWHIISLNEFRLWFNRSLVSQKGKIPGFSNNNKDQSSSFRAFSTLDMPECIIKSRGFEVIKPEPTTEFHW